MTRKVHMFSTDVVCFSTSHPVVLGLNPDLGDVRKCSITEIYP